MTSNAENNIFFIAIFFALHLSDFPNFEKSDPLRFISLSIDDDISFHVKQGKTFYD